MNLAENSFLLKALRISLIGAPFIFTLLYVPGFLYPGNFPRAIFLYLAISVTLVIWLVHIFKSGNIMFQNNWLTIAIFSYLLVLFISSIAGGHFGYSFFGDYTRTNGIILFIYLGYYRMVNRKLYCNHISEYTIYG